MTLSSPSVEAAPSNGAVFQAASLGGMRYRRYKCEEAVEPHEPLPVWKLV